MSTHDWGGPPPDLEPSDPLKAVLASALEQGAPLQAPYPSQARYSRLAGLAERPPWRRTILAFAAGAALMSLAFLFTGVPQPRTWIVQTVDSVVHDITAPAATPPAESSAPGTQPERPETTPSENEAHESPPHSESGESPSGEAGEASPTPSPESSGDGDHQAEGPTSDSGGRGGSDDGSSDDGGASSPSSAQTPDSDGGH